MRQCKNCGAPVTGHGNRVYCDNCKTPAQRKSRALPEVSARFDWSGVTDQSISQTVDEAGLPNLTSIAAFSQSASDAPSIPLLAANSIVPDPITPPYPGNDSPSFSSQSFTPKLSSPVQPATDAAQQEPYGYLSPSADYQRRKDTRAAYEAMAAGAERDEIPINQLGVSRSGVRELHLGGLTTTLGGLQEAAAKDPVGTHRKIAGMDVPQADRDILIQSAGLEHINMGAAYYSAPSWDDYKSQYTVRQIYSVVEEQVLDSDANKLSDSQIQEKYGLGDYEIYRENRYKKVQDQSQKETTPYERVHQKTLLMARHRETGQEFHLQHLIATEDGSPATTFTTTVDAGDFSSWDTKSGLAPSQIVQLISPEGDIVKSQEFFRGGIEGRTAKVKNRRDWQYGRFISKTGFYMDDGEGHISVESANKLKRESVQNVQNEQIERTKRAQAYVNAKISSGEPATHEGSMNAAGVNTFSGRVLGAEQLAPLPQQYAAPELPQEHIIPSKIRSAFERAQARFDRMSEVVEEAQSTAIPEIVQRRLDTSRGQSVRGASAMYDEAASERGLEGASEYLRQSLGNSVFVSPVQYGDIGLPNEGDRAGASVPYVEFGRLRRTEDGQQAMENYKLFHDSRYGTWGVMSEDNYSGLNIVPSMVKDDGTIVNPVQVLKMGIENSLSPDTEGRKPNLWNALSNFGLMHVNWTGYTPTERRRLSRSFFVGRSMPAEAGGIGEKRNNEQIWSAVDAAREKGESIYMRRNSQHAFGLRGLLGEAGFTKRIRRQADEKGNMQIVRDEQGSPVYDFYVNKIKRIQQLDISGTNVRAAAGVGMLLPEFTSQFTEGGITGAVTGQSAPTTGFIMQSAFRTSKLGIPEGQRMTLPTYGVRDFTRVVAPNADIAEKLFFTDSDEGGLPPIGEGYKYGGSMSDFERMTGRKARGTMVAIEGVENITKNGEDAQKIKYQVYTDQVAYKYKDKGEGQFRDAAYFDQYGAGVESVSALPSAKDMMTFAHKGFEANFTVKQAAKQIAQFNRAAKKSDAAIAQVARDEMDLLRQLSPADLRAAGIEGIDKFDPTKTGHVMAALNANQVSGQISPVMSNLFGLAATDWMYSQGEIKQIKETVGVHEYEQHLTGLLADSMTDQIMSQRNITDRGIAFKLATEQIERQAGTGEDRISNLHQMMMGSSANTISTAETVTGKPQQSAQMFTDAQFFRYDKDGKRIGLKSSVGATNVDVTMNDAVYNVNQLEQARWEGRRPMGRVTAESAFWMYQDNPQLFQALMNQSKTGQLDDPSLTAFRAYASNFEGSGITGQTVDTPTGKQHRLSTGDSVNPFDIDTYRMAQSEVASLYGKESADYQRKMVAKAYGMERGDAMSLQTSSGEQVNIMGGAIAASFTTISDDDKMVSGVGQSVIEAMEAQAKYHDAKQAHTQGVISDEELHQFALANDQAIKGALETQGEHFSSAEVMKDVLGFSVVNIGGKAHGAGSVPENMTVMSEQFLMELTGLDQWEDQSSAAKELRRIVNGRGREQLTLSAKRFPEVSPFHNNVGLKIGIYEDLVAEKSQVVKGLLNPGKNMVFNPIVAQVLAGDFDGDESRGILNWVTDKRGKWRGGNVRRISPRQLAKAAKNMPFSEWYKQVEEAAERRPSRMATDTAKNSQEKGYKTDDQLYAAYTEEEKAAAAQIGQQYNAEHRGRRIMAMAQLQNVAAKNLYGGQGLPGTHLSNIVSEATSYKAVSAYQSSLDREVLGDPGFLRMYDMSTQAIFREGGRIAIPMRDSKNPLQYATIQEGERAGSKKYETFASDADFVQNMIETAATTAMPQRGDFETEADYLAAREASDDEYRRTSALSFAAQLIPLERLAEVSNADAENNVGYMAEGGALYNQVQATSDALMNIRNADIIASQSGETTEAVRGRAMQQLFGSFRMRGVRNAAEYANLDAERGGVMYTGIMGAANARAEMRREGSSKFDWIETSANPFMKSATRMAREVAKVMRVAYLDRPPTVDERSSASMTQQISGAFSSFFKGTRQLLSRVGIVGGVEAGEEGGISKIAVDQKLADVGYTPTPAEIQEQRAASQATKSTLDISRLAGGEAVGIEQSPPVRELSLANLGGTSSPILPAENLVTLRPVEPQPAKPQILLPNAPRPSAVVRPDGIIEASPPVKPEAALNLGGMVGLSQLIDDKPQDYNIPDNIIPAWKRGTHAYNMPEDFVPAWQRGNTPIEGFEPIDYSSIPPTEAGQYLDRDASGKIVSRPVSSERSRPLKHPTEGKRYLEPPSEPPSEPPDETTLTPEPPERPGRGSGRSPSAGEVYHAVFKGVQAGMAVAQEEKTFYVHADRDMDKRSYELATDIEAYASPEGRNIQTSKQAKAAQSFLDSTSDRFRNLRKRAKQGSLNAEERMFLSKSKEVLLPYLPGHDAGSVFSDDEIESIDQLAAAFNAYSGEFYREAGYTPETLHLATRELPDRVATPAHAKSMMTVKQSMTLNQKMALGLRAMGGVGAEGVLNQNAAAMGLGAGGLDLLPAATGLKELNAEFKELIAKLPEATKLTREQHKMVTKLIDLSETVQAVTAQMDEKTARQREDMFGGKSVSQLTKDEAIQLFTGKSAAEATPEDLAKSRDFKDWYTLYGREMNADGKSVRGVAGAIAPYQAALADADIRMDLGQLTQESPFGERAFRGVVGAYYAGSAARHLYQQTVGESLKSIREFEGTEDIYAMLGIGERGDIRKQRFAAERAEMFQARAAAEMYLPIMQGMSDLLGSADAGRIVEGAKRSTAIFGMGLMGSQMLSQSGFLGAGKTFGQASMVAAAGSAGLSAGNLVYNQLSGASEFGGLSEMEMIEEAFTQSGNLSWMATDIGLAASNRFLGTDFELTGVRSQGVKDRVREEYERKYHLLDDDIEFAEQNDVSTVEIGEYRNRLRTTLAAPRQESSSYVNYARNATLIGERTGLGKEGIANYQGAMSSLYAGGNTREAMGIEIMEIDRLSPYIGSSAFDKLAPSITQEVSNYQRMAGIGSNLRQFIDDPDKVKEIIDNLLPHAFGDYVSDSAIRQAGRVVNQGMNITSRSALDLSSSVGVMSALSGKPESIQDLMTEVVANRSSIYYAQGIDSQGMQPLLDATTQMGLSVSEAQANNLRSLSQLEMRYGNTNDRLFRQVAGLSGVQGEFAVQAAGIGAGMGYNFSALDIPTSFTNLNEAQSQAALQLTQSLQLNTQSQSFSDLLGSRSGMVGGLFGRQLQMGTGSILDASRYYWTGSGSAEEMATMNQARDRMFNMTDQQAQRAASVTAMTERYGLGYGGRGMTAFDDLVDDPLRFERASNYMGLYEQLAIEPTERDMAAAARKSQRGEQYSRAYRAFSTTAYEMGLDGQTSLQIAENLTRRGIVNQRDVGLASGFANTAFGMGVDASDAMAVGGMLVNQGLTSQPQAQAVSTFANLAYGMGMGGQEAMAFAGGMAKQYSSPLQMQSFANMSNLGFNMGLSSQQSLAFGQMVTDAGYTPFQQSRISSLSSTLMGMGVEGTGALAFGFGNADMSQLGMVQLQRFLGGDQMMFSRAFQGGLEGLDSLGLSLDNIRMPSGRKLAPTMDYRTGLSASKTSSLMLSTTHPIR
ncbi:MAG: hypothetical protein HC892_00230 [Saprospiraceae bacterium]|nr:hypothetical protein [Saprospiraceae bacterium]